MSAWFLSSSIACGSKLTPAPYEKAQTSWEMIYMRAVRSSRQLSTEVLHAHECVEHVAPIYMRDESKRHITKKCEKHKNPNPYLSILTYSPHHCQVLQLVLAHVTHPGRNDMCLYVNIYLRSITNEAQAPG